MTPDKQPFVENTYNGKALEIMQQKHNNKLMKGMLSNICVSKECKCLRSVIRLVCFEEIVNFIHKLDMTALGHTYDPRLLKSPTYLMYSGGSDSAIVTRDDATSSSSTEGP